MYDGPNDLPGSETAIFRRLCRLLCDESLTHLDAEPNPSLSGDYAAVRVARTLSYPCMT